MLPQSCLHVNIVDLCTTFQNGSAFVAAIRCLMDRLTESKVELEDDNVETPTLETWPSLTWMGTRGVILTEKTEKGIEGREINGSFHPGEYYIRSHISSSEE